MAHCVSCLLMTSIGVVLVICLLSSTIRAQRSDDIGFALTRQKQYRVITSFTLSWQEAYEYCRSIGMFLVSIHNQAEYDAVKTEIRKADLRKYQEKDDVGFWTSLNDIDEEGEYYWASTGFRNTFDVWADYQPNNLKEGKCTDEDCIILSHQVSSNKTHGYQDRPCSYFFFIICETLD